MKRRRIGECMNYDVLIIGAGPGGIFSAYELIKQDPNLRVGVFEAGHALGGRKCPIDGNKIKSCIGCKTCSIMSGFGGAGAFSDGKYNITNDFGGTLYEYIGKKEAIDLMRYVDTINLAYGGEGTKLYSTAGSRFKKQCMQNDLHLLDASVRHLGTDINYVVLENLYEYLKDKVEFYFDTLVEAVEVLADGEEGYRIQCKDASYTCKDCIISVGRSGSKWMEEVCKDLSIPTNSNRVDIGVRVELPAEIFSHLTDELYESKIVYRTQKYEDKVRTFCMNPKGAVVNENTNGIITVNGHSYEDPEKQTENTNFALLVSKHFSEPFKDSNGYGESIARLSNMLGGGVMVQRFGDLIRGQRSTRKRIEESFVTPTLNATPGDLSLVLPKRILDGIVEMIYALDKIAPGTANDDTLLYGVEVKFYNMEVEVDEHLQTNYKGLYVIGDGSGITHSLSHASASGVYVAREIAGNQN
ncbi:NAD(P)/FAD-dependent oxidoreductase [Roseburia sp. AM16-25]|uniref:NAD(P)/FAD-dependent oxidoreductase n=1 Tax=Roseburia sp. AM16-25 TaxID=2292065 RepID=UPI000E4B1226|nr:NAD(P)/FAD-dependent oxidoreductase [Roseburia sp. AM16-25]RHO32904.1 NAD(P)/FAD-dependent oxidoreductase [Roseburia sp. AM16-25]